MNRMRPLVVLAFLAALISPGLVFAAPVQHRGVIIRLLDAPANRRDDPRARIYIVDHVPPGATITRHVEVRNDTGSSANISVYTASARLHDGSFDVAPRSEVSELTTWVKLAPVQLSLAQGQAATVKVAISVPANASPGERYAAVLAELPPPPNGQIRVATRVGIRVYLSVGAGGEPASNFAIDTITASRAADGRPVVTAQVHNTGGRALDMTGSLRLTHGPGALSAGPFPAKLGTTLGIGQTEPVTVLLDKSLPAGPWLARLDLQSGLLKRAATATITFPDKGAAAPVAAKLVQEKKKSPPWLLIGLGFVVLLLLLFFLWFILKRRSRPRDTRDDVVVQTPR